MARYLFGRRLRGQAQMVEVVQASPDRVSPRCPHFGSCSACSLQHLDPAAQIRFKHHLLSRHLEKASVPGPRRWLEPLQADLWHYRRKARLSVRLVPAKGRVLVGFRERDGRFVADMTGCHVLPRVVAGQLNALSRLVGELEGLRQVPQIEITCGDEACALVFRHLESLSEADEERLRAFANETGLFVLLQSGGPDTVRPLAPPDPTLQYHLPAFGLRYRFSPQDFVQVNASINGHMIQQALELLQPVGQDRVLELFCGLGNFSLPLAQRSAEVIAVEGDAGLVDRAQLNAIGNGIGNVTFLHSDLHTEPVGVLLPEGPFDKVLLDPPRSGAGAVLPVIGQSAARRVVYVSCNPESLASDAAELTGSYGYRLEAAGVMDMFPHTAHVESMALFVKD
jgi:23S rRNA (uracil1939-C5)-methyltransferase